MMHLEKSWSVASNLTPRCSRGTNPLFPGSLAIGASYHCSHGTHRAGTRNVFLNEWTKLILSPCTPATSLGGLYFYHWYYLSFPYHLGQKFCIDPLQHHPFFPLLSTKDPSFLWPLFLTLIILGFMLLTSVQNYQNNLTALPVISLPSMLQSH